MNKLVQGYPHPVLRAGSDDLLDKIFLVSDSPVIASNLHYIIELQITNTCDELRDLIRAGKATYALRIVCRTTMYRDFFMFSEETHKIHIPRKNLLHGVVLYPMIVALKDLDNYVCSSFHPDYQGMQIQVNAGDILGIADSICFDAPECTADDETLESIIQFQKDGKNSVSCVNINDSGNKITIKLSSDLYDKTIAIQNTNQHRPGISEMLMSMYAIPALTQVLATKFNESILEKSQAEFANQEWFRVIRDRFFELEVLDSNEKGDIDLEKSEVDISSNPYEYAEMLLNMPIHPAVNFIAEDLVDYEEDE
ncbi:MAG: hypothetical protein M0P33_05710 [Massilibacteroides sp.]|jgi:hypothetical protein|nr:hypothetical protein [Massilibacteroides sp.]